jgi:long-chain fatty acid transport protein
VGSTAINPRGHFTNSTTGTVSTLNVRYYPVPNVYYKGTFAGGRAAAGFGLFAPYGLTSDWPTTSEGRFLAYKSVVQGIYMQPTIAFKASDKVAVGLGVDITRTGVELRQRLDLAPIPITGTTFTFGTLPVGPVPKGTDFADVQLKGHAWHAGVNVGVVAKASDKVSLGARWLSGQRVDITNGTVTYSQIQTGLTTSPLLGPVLGGKSIDALVAPNFAAGGRLSNQTATTSIPLPDQFVAGIAVQATPKVLALVDYQFVRWSMFDSLVVTQSIAGTQTTVENFGNTSGVRFGVDYAVTPTTSVRAGADIHGAAEPAENVTPLLPEGSRVEIAGGVGHKFGAARLDAYYMYLHQGDRAGRTVAPGSGNNGTYAFMSHLFGVTLAFAF